jgi:hypothetical protein
MRQIEHATHVKIKNAYKILVEKPEEKRPFGRPKHTWKDNIKMDFKKQGVKNGLNSSGSKQGPVAGSCEHNNETSGSTKGRECID